MRVFNFNFLQRQGLFRKTKATPISERIYLYLFLIFVFNSFSMQSPQIKSLLTLYFGKHCIEVPLKPSFFAQGTEKMVPISESPSYPGSHLCEVFLLRNGEKMRGPRKTVLLSESPSYPGSHLTRVYCITFPIASPNQPKIVSS